MDNMKFRAWDIKFSVMIYSDRRNEKDYPIVYDFVIDKNGAIKCMWIESFDDSYGFPAEASGKLNNIMLYTGMKDRNDIELYEGDVIRWEYHNHLTNRKDHIDYYVEWENGCFWARCIGGMADALLYFENERCSVIGNIYENPELCQQDDIS